MPQQADLIVSTARSWVGTPYRHQAMLKGVGVDCVGVIIGVGHEAVVLSISAEDWAPYANYSRNPNPRKMLEAMNRFLVPIEGPGAPGSIAWLQWREDLPMHLAIVGELEGRPTLIHAYGDVGRCVEHGFTPLWRSRVASWWRYPGDF